MIVKVQISIESSDDETYMLLYDRKRKYQYENTATEEVIKLMNGSPKKYFEAELVDDPENVGKKKIQLNNEVKYQNW